MKKHLKSTLAIMMAFAMLAAYSFSPQNLTASAVTGDSDQAVAAEQANDEVTEPETEATEEVTNESEKVTNPGKEESEQAEESSDKADAEEADVETDADDADVEKKDADAASDVDESKDTEPTKADKEVKYPAADFTKKAGNMTVKISAPKGALPEGATVKVEAVKASEVKDAVEDLIDNAKVVKAVDITFYNKEGKEIEPKEKVSVSFASDQFGELDKPAVLHINDEGDAEKVKGAKVDTDLNKATFKSDEFSIYVVVESGDDARLSVVFHQAGGDEVTIKVKKADLDPDAIDTLVYDPGAGDVSGLVFAGWTTEEEYDVDTEPKTIDGIRDVVRAELQKSYTDGDVLDIYAMVFKQIDITYLDPYGTSLGADVIKFPADSSATSYSYEINMNYEPEDNNHNFEGWWVDKGGSNIAGFDPNANDGKGTLYQNETTVQISGDVVFSVNAPEGRWLIFNENGKGATYNAPKFLKTGEVTSKPCDDEDMLRYGYTFDGWYNGTEEEIEGKTVINLTTPFEFGDPITDHTTIYAKWEPKTDAKYTVIFWTQNSKSIDKETLDKDTDYDLAASTVENGTVGETIPYEIVNNGAEDYATVGGEDYHYTGFCAKAPDEDVTITAEGDAVLNIYFDRIQYNLRFYLYREQVGGGANRFTYANNSLAGQNTWGIVSWHPAVNANNVPTTTYGDVLESEEIDGYIGHYFVLQAFYGEDISSKWPSYDEIQGSTAHPNPVSYVMMNGTGLKPNPSAGGDGTVKGVITVMDEKILGATNQVNGNFLIVRFQQNYNNWRYHIMFETAEGEGGTYEEADEPISPIVSRSSNIDLAQQTPPQFEGFKFNRKEGGQPSGGIYHAYFYYDRLKYKVNFLDGIYVDGNGNTVKEDGENELSQSDEIAYGATIPNSVKNYVPDLPAGEAGYVFEGWYADKACNTKYEFGTMPAGGVTVYAKWREIQYRVFLHPNAGTDATLDWGDDSVAMNFRVSYGGKVSTPTGTRTGYEFAGWYRDEALKNAFNSKAFVLNEETVPSSPAYNKKTDLTDNMTKWGTIESNSPTPSGETGPGYNSDTYSYKNGTFTKNDRFWITKKLDLYAKWRSVAEGSRGVTVLYDAEDGYFDYLDGKPSTRTDEHLYVDGAEAIGGTASTPNKDNQYFLYWVLQTWDAEEGKYTDTDTHVLPSEDYTVLLSNAKPYITKWINPKDADDAVTPDDPTSMTAPDETHTKIGEATYTLKLRAVYGEREAPTQTHIIWYANGGTGGDNGFILDPIDKELKVNEEVAVKPADTFTREGYEFLGWGKKKFDPESKPPIDDDGNIIEENFSVDDTLTTWLDWDGEQFTEKGTGVKADYIAADEVVPYEEVYAIWAPKLLVKIEGKTATKEYDGTKQSVSGYTIKYTYGDTKDSTTAPTGVTVSLKDGSSAVAEGTDVDTYPMGLTEDDFEVTLSEDAKVKYDPEDEDSMTVTDGWLKIKPCPVVVTITGHKDTKTYNGEEQKVEGFDVSIDEDLYSEDDFSFDGEAVAKGTEVDTYPMGLSKDQFTNNNDNFEVTFKVTDGELVIVNGPVPKKKVVTVEIKTSPKTVTYNGKNRTYNKYTVTYKIDGEVVDSLPAGLEAEMTPASPAAKGKDAGSYSKSFSVKVVAAENVLDSNALRSGKTDEYDLTNAHDSAKLKLKIKPAPLTVTTPSASKEYDGKALTSKKATLKGLVGGETAKATATGSQTEVGSSKNGYEITWGTAKADNYKITEKLGTLTVTDAGDEPTPPTPTPTPTPTPAPPGGGGGPAVGVPAVINPVPTPVEIDDTPTPTTIDEEPVPMADNAVWALINLLCTIATALLSLIMLVRYFGKRREEDEETGEETRIKKKGGARVASLIPAIGAIIAFILTEDMSNPMVMVDKWTLMMVVILAIQVGVAIVAKKKKDEDDEDYAAEG